MRYGLDEVFAPEQEIDFGKTYTGAGGQPVKWKTMKTPENGYFSLWDKVTPYEFVVTYTVSWIYSPADKEVVLMEGSDDGIKVFLNDEPVFRFLDVRIAAPDQDTIPLNLKKGWNKLMLKVENNFGGYAFFARIVDRERNLVFKSGIGSDSPNGR